VQEEVDQTHPSSDQMMMIASHCATTINL